jgi:hypothetical protein
MHHNTALSERLVADHQQRLRAEADAQGPDEWAGCHAAWGGLVVHLAANSLGVRSPWAVWGRFQLAAAAPVVDDHSGFEHAVELPAVEELVTELSVERFNPGVLSRAAGIDEHAGGAGEAAPVRDRVRDELGSVVEPDVHKRCTACDREAVEHRDDVVCVD